MKKLMLVTLMLSLPFSIQAGEAEKKQSIEELMQVTRVEAMIDAMYSQMDRMFSSMAKEMDIKPSEQAMFEKHMKQINEVMRKEITWQKMKTQIMPIYMKYYTEKELQDMLAFYRTDTGKSLIDKMPAVMQESMMISQNMMIQAMPKIKQVIADMKKEIQMARKGK